MNGKLPLPKLDKVWFTELKNKVFKKPWSYWVGGIILAIINIIYIIVVDDYWSITTNFLRWGAWILEQISGVNTKSWEVWNYDKYIIPWLDKSTWSNLGIITGAFLAILLAQQFKLKKIKNKKQLLIGLVGGWLMGYGARVAMGCNIGGLYSAISALSISGWLYIPFIILGIFIGSKILAKWFI